MNSSALSISVIILTFNEEKQIERCIKSAEKVSQDIFIVDSFSNDMTVEIANNLGAKVFSNRWVNYSRQFNWALANLPIKTKWIMRLDCDEYLTEELTQEINTLLPSLSEDITGIILKRRVYFMNSWVKHGGYYPINLLRIWQNGKGKCEERWMDEHIKIIEGKTIFFENDIVDDNVNNLTWWTNKHNNYATREAIDLLNIRYGFNKTEKINPSLNSTQDKKKRWVKERIYLRMPLFIRPFFYFIYRYLFKLGFLDGIPGLIWHFLQGFWYRFLVDAKIYDIKRRAKKENNTIPEIINKYYNVVN